LRCRRYWSGCRWSTIGSSLTDGSKGRRRFAHWILATSLLTLAFSGLEILMVHPRLYWGEAGNDLMPALLELPSAETTAMAVQNG
jgi:hypothetical protein